MKYIALILTILTITLSAIPCDDEVANFGADTTVVSTDIHHSSSDFGDLCSPFCTCVCCASVVVHPSFVQDTLISENINTEVNTSYFFSYSSDYLNRIFQPPRV